MAEVDEVSLELTCRAAAWAGRSLTTSQVEAMVVYADWLVREAIPAGGLGPREGGRIWGRHIGDSLVFGAAWKDRDPPEILDVGSGVGLPGIPLAIMYPETRVTLLDRGGRRVRLLRRIASILSLPNVVVAQGDVFSVADEWQGVVFRGAVKPPEAVGLAARLLMPGGRAVLGLSRRTEAPPEAEVLVTLAGALGLASEVVEVPPDILDAVAWLLIMRLSD